MTMTLAEAVAEDLANLNPTNDPTGLQRAALSSYRPDMPLDEVASIASRVRGAVSTRVWLGAGNRALVEATAAAITVHLATLTTWLQGGEARSALLMSNPTLTMVELQDDDTGKTELVEAPTMAQTLALAAAWCGEQKP